MGDSAVPCDLDASRSHDVVCACTSGQPSKLRSLTSSSGRSHIVRPLRQRGSIKTPTITTLIAVIGPLCSPHPQGGIGILRDCLIISQSIWMATWAYPPLPPEQLVQEAASALTRELEWLLRSLQESLLSLKEGLQECASLLAPKDPGSTLVLSSPRSESVKGFVTRIGTKIIKGDIQLRLNSLPPRGSASIRLSFSSSPGAPELVLNQLVSVRNLINQSLDIVDVSTWTGDQLNARFIFSQLHLLHETIAEARQMLKGDTEDVRGKWGEASADENTFDPPLPPYLSFHLCIADSALVLFLRTLEPSSPAHTPTTFTTDLSLTGFSLRDRLFGPRLPPHDETGAVFTWRGEEVKVKEKIRVESQDPSLMAVMAKLTALQYEVLKWIASLKVLMGDDDSESEP